MSSGRRKGTVATAAYFIVEHSGGRIFCYREDSDHHKVAEASRAEDGLVRVDASILDMDCDIGQSMPENSYMVISLKPDTP